MSESASKQGSGQQAGNLLNELPLDRLRDSAQDLLFAFAERAVGSAGKRVEDFTRSLTEGGGGGNPLGSLLSAGQTAAKVAKPVQAATSGLKGAASGAKDMAEKAGQAVGGGGSSGGATTARVTNILEKIDVGVPIRLAYDQWTQFEDFPNFMRKVEKVEQESDEKVNWTARIFFSHRTWKATILEQIPDDRVVWVSEGNLGYVNGAVTFHALAPNMTRIIAVLEYHPQGFLEKTANLWRPQGRRARADIRHFVRHVLTQTVLEPDQVEGWRGEIRNGEVVKTHEEAIREEQEAAEEDTGEEYDEGEYEDEDYAEEEEPEEAEEPAPAR